MGRVQLTAWHVSLLVTLSLLGLYLATGQTSLMRNVETKLLDLRLRLRGEQHPKVPIALVLIDDKSIAALGREANHSRNIERHALGRVRQVCHADVERRRSQGDAIAREIDKSTFPRKGKLDIETTLDRGSRHDL